MYMCPSLSDCVRYDETGRSCMHCDCRRPGHPHGQAWLNDVVIHSYLALLAHSYDAYVLPSFLGIRWQQSTPFVTREWMYTRVQMARHRWILMPLHVNGNHWALLVADVAAGTVGIADSVTSESTCTTFLALFKRYMAARAELTSELAEWTDTQYDMPQQQDTSSCGVLCLMAAEALLQSVPLSAVQPASAQLYRKYIQTRLIMNSRLYDSEGDAVCDLPFCQQPTGARITWTQCDQCDRWCHNCCCVRVRSASWQNKGFICDICQCGDIK